MSDTQTARAYTPKAHILFGAQAQLAEQNAPAIFRFLVEQAEAERYAPSPALELLSVKTGETLRTNRTTGEQYTAPTFGPYKFVVDVARKVAAGEKFTSDLNFAQVVGKGGTFAEWTWNSFRFLADKGLAPELSATS